MGLFSKKWRYLLILSLIWGSSFILMKKGLLGVAPIQLGALRIIFTTFFLVTIGFSRLKTITSTEWKWIALSGVLNAFLPIFFYAYAVSEIDSAIVSVLNGVTPFNTLWIGLVLFGISFKKEQLWGVFIGLIGVAILILKGADLNPDQQYGYAIFPFLASLCYSLNINIIKKYLSGVDSLAIAAGNFIVVFIPACLVLLFSDFYASFEWNAATRSAFMYIIILAILCTSIAKVLYNKLIKISSPVFSSSVTYLIPLVATAWGIFDGEKLSIVQLFAALLILAGVYLVNKHR